MSPAPHPAPDAYLRRIGVAAALVLLALVGAALLGPSADPDAEWYERTGVQGPELILRDIDIVTDVDPITQDRERSMPDATVGVAPPITDDVVVERTEMPLPLPTPPGHDGTNTSMRKVVEGTDEFVDERDRVEMNRASQQSMDFVLLRSVSPRYPQDANAMLRAREILVKVNMYVDETGHVAQAYVDRNNGGTPFERAVLDAVRQWVYEPLLVDGQPTGFWDIIYFRFNTPTSRPEASDLPPASGG